MQDPRPASLISPIRPRLRRTTGLVLMALASGTALAQDDQERDIQTGRREINVGHSDSNCDILV
ncbi:hypothetical protein [Achromobacter insuavis]|uniref:hypothetical protein n=1 Tax=Achromobacter insuavis TaxID=1287735 RepID=UPI001EEB8FE6|nr:hypothetical protein [Achromobacter insuavis]